MENKPIGCLDCGHFNGYEPSECLCKCHDALPEPFDRQKNADVQPIPRSQKRGITSSDPDWRERFDKMFDLDNGMSTARPVQNLVKSFIAEVEKLAEEHGKAKGFGETLYSGDGAEIIRSSLKAELIEAGEKMKPKDENHSAYWMLGYARAKSDYQDIIKSA